MKNEKFQEFSRILLVGIILIISINLVNALQGESDNVDFRFSIGYGALNETNSNSVRLNVDTVANSFSNDDSKARFGILQYDIKKPVVDSVSITPISPLDSDVMNCQFNVTDDEKLNLTANITWYKNGVSWGNDDLFNFNFRSGLLNSTHNTIAEIEPAKLINGDNWICSINAYDGYQDGGFVNSSAIIVGTETVIPPGTSGGDKDGRNEKKESKFEVTPNVIQTILVQGNLDSKEIGIINTGDVAQVINVIGENLSRFMSVSENYVVVYPKETKKINANFYAPDDQEPDVYFGKIRLESLSGIQSIINVILEIKKKEALFDVKTEIFDDLEVMKNDYVEGEIFLYNIGDLKDIDVELYYSIRDLDGNDIIFEHESLNVNEQKVVNRRLKIPDFLKDGHYLFYASIEYQGLKQASSSGLFEVSGERVERLKEFQVNNYLWFSVGLIIIILLVLILSRLNSWMRSMNISLRLSSLRKEKVGEPTLLERRKKELEEYIEKMIESGKSMNVVMKDLKEHGWPRKVIDNEIKKAIEKFKK